MYLSIARIQIQTYCNGITTQEHVLSSFTIINASNLALHNRELGKFNIRIIQDIYKCLTNCTYIQKPNYQIITHGGR